MTATVEAPAENQMWGSYTKLVANTKIVLAIAWVLFQIASAMLNVPDPARARVIHLTFAMTFVYLSFPFRRGNNNVMHPFERVVNIFAILLAIIGAIYMYTQYDLLIWRIGVPLPGDIIFGFIEIVLILEAVRRCMGWPLVILVVLFIVYGYVGPYMPSILSHRGLSTARIMSNLYLGDGGIWGILLGVSATYVASFIIFGSFFNITGAGTWFINISYGLAGWMAGGPAKMAVIASALFGTISGNSAANVVTTGTFTIPLMKRVGYNNAFAGAVEAVSSTGGQIMPPVMGAAAFLMVQILGVSYPVIVKAALLPAILYFASELVGIHFEAKKLKLEGLPRNELPPIWDTFKQGWFYLLPVIVLLYLIFVQQLSPIYSALVASFVSIAISVFNKNNRISIEKFKDACIDASGNMIQVAVACAAAGILVGMVSLTGLGFRISELILYISGENLMITLVLSAIASIIFGIGMPTTAVYIVVSSLIAPAIVDLGIQPMAAHLFIFYFACLSAITPPVAVAAYAAAPLAKADPMDVGIKAFKLGLVAFIIPFMFVDNQALMLEGSILTVSLAIISAMLGVCALCGSISGWFITNLKLWERILLFVAAIVMLKVGLVTDIIGAAILAFFIVRNLGKKSE
ncbi:MAG: TRAP transporter permease [Dehalobacterium sp.]